MRDKRDSETRRLEGRADRYAIKISVSLTYEMTDKSIKQRKGYLNIGKIQNLDFLARGYMRCTISCKTG